MRWWVKVLIGLGVSLAVGTISFVTWASFAAPANAERFEAAQKDSGIVYQETGETITLLSVARSGEKGVLLYPGAKVQAAAYVAPYLNLVKNHGMTIVIVKPILNLALLDIRDSERYRRAAPNVKSWFVAGHSIGGVKACTVIDSNPDAYDGLILLGSYCSISLTGNTRVLSVGGEKDGLTTPGDIEKNKANLPSGTRFVNIVGMNHAQFGDYGEQSGDTSATIDQYKAWSEVRSAIARF